MKSGQQGMLMLEVLVALLIFSVGVLGLVSMQSLSTATSVNAEDRSTAAILANDMVADLWANNSATPVAANYSAWQARVSGSGLRGAKGKVTTAANAATVTVCWWPQARFGMATGTTADCTAGATASAQPAQFVTTVTIQ